MQKSNTITLNALQDSLLDSIKMYYNIHLKGGIDNYNYYLSLITFEHLSVQDRILHPTNPRYPSIGKI